MGAFVVSDCGVTVVSRVGSAVLYSSCRSFVAFVLISAVLHDFQSIIIFDLK